MMVADRTSDFGAGRLQSRATRILFAGLLGPEGTMSSSRLVNRNVTSTGGRTSMRLEPELWSALEEICHRESMTLAELVKSIERRGHPGGRTSAVRVFVLTYYRNAAIDEGHRAAGHGMMGQLADAPESPWRATQRREDRARLS